MTSGLVHYLGIKSESGHLEQQERQFSRMGGIVFLYRCSI